MNDSIFCLPNEERIIDRIEQLVSIWTTSPMVCVLRLQKTSCNGWKTFRSNGSSDQKERNAPCRSCPQRKPSLMPTSAS